jgi:hypothetical protein
VWPGTGNVAGHDDPSALVNSTECEVHAFVLWSNALPAANRILEDLASRFELVGAYRIAWRPERFHENLIRLYGFDLPERANKEATSGTGPFLLLVVRDPQPVYEARSRSWGVGLVNIATYDRKQRYRAWTGGDFRVHATIEPRESDRDLFMLIGRRSASFLKAPALPWDAPPEAWQADVLGEGGWTSLEELLTALDVTGRFAIVREEKRAEPPRLTLLVDDRRRARLIAAGSDAHGTRAQVRTGGKLLELVLREPGDRLLDPEWERAMLRERVRDGSGAWAVSREHRFFGRLYEAVAHESVVSTATAAELSSTAAAVGAPAGDYSDPRFARAVLGDFLRRAGWRYSLPADPRVPRNPAVLGREARLRRALKRRAPRAVRIAGRIRDLARRKA